MQKCLKLYDAKLNRMHSLIRYWVKNDPGRKQPGQQRITGNLFYLLCVTFLNNAEPHAASVRHLSFLFIDH